MGAVLGGSAVTKSNFDTKVGCKIEDDRSELPDIEGVMCRFLGIGLLLV